MKTLREIQVEYFKLVLEMHRGNRIQTAKTLAISERTVRNELVKLRESGFIEMDYSKLEPTPKEKFEYLRRANKLFPTNEERIHYMDNFPNRCSRAEH